MPNHALVRIANGLSGGQIDSLSEAVELYGEIALTNQQNNELLEERLAELELALDDQGYERLGGLSETQFDKASIDKIARMARVYWLKNPLIKRSVATQVNYVFGKGLTVKAADPDVQEVIDAFLEDSRNSAELTGDQAIMSKEAELEVTGNLFLAFFTDRMNGATRVRSIPLNEIVRIVFNPEDSREPWYYLRRWEQPKEAGSHKTVICEAAYPDINYNPVKGLPTNFNGIPVMKDTPVYHVKVNCLGDMDYGVSEIYAAIDWAKAYKEFLEDWYTIVKSLSKFSWKATSKAGALGIESAQAKLKQAVNPANGDLPGQAGNVWMSTDNFDLTPMPKSGATVSVEDGRRALLMVCAATGIFEHYFGDPSTGNLATATAMEQPMLLMFQARQRLWVDVFEVLLNYVIDRNAIATSGKLHGVETFNDYGERVVDTGELDRSFTVSFPPILEDDVAQRVDAIVKSVTLGGGQPAGTIDLKTATTELLQALGEDTGIVDTLFPDEVEPWQNAPLAAGEAEEAYISRLDKLVHELRETGL